MGKSGQRYTYPAIIDSPEHRSYIRFAVEWGITMVFWIIWLYWVLPIFFAAVAVVGLKVPSLPTLLSLKNMLVKSGKILMIIFSIEYLWMGYNYLRISKIQGERRRRTKRCTKPLLARYLDTRQDIVTSMARCRRVEVRVEGQMCTIVSADNELCMGERLHIPT